MPEVYGYSAIILQLFPLLQMATENHKGAAQWQGVWLVLCF